LWCKTGAENLKAHISSQAFLQSEPKYPLKKEALEAFANRLSDEDNPVLMVVTMK
jgi:hypothetical protein